jgi:hypothetical protein
MLQSGSSYLRILQHSYLLVDNRRRLVDDLRRRLLVDLEARNKRRGRIKRGREVSRSDVKPFALVQGRQFNSPPAAEELHTEAEAAPHRRAKKRRKTRKAECVTDMRFLPPAEFQSQSLPSYSALPGAEGHTEAAGRTAEHTEEAAAGTVKQKEEKEASVGSAQSLFSIVVHVHDMFEHYLRWRLLVLLLRWGLLVLLLWRWLLILLLLLLLLGRLGRDHGRSALRIHALMMSLVRAGALGDTGALELHSDLNLAGGFTEVIRLLNVVPLWLSGEIEFVQRIVNATNLIIRNSLLVPRFEVHQILVTSQVCDASEVPNRSLVLVLSNTSLELKERRNRSAAKGGSSEKRFE